MTHATMLALDLGSDSGRCFAGHFDGETLRLAEGARWANTPVWVGEHMHWNVLGLWHAVGAALRAAGAQHGDAVVSMGVCTWGLDFALLAADDTLLDMPHHYRDPRTNGMVEVACALAGREAIFEQTGIQFLALNTLFQLLALAQRGAPALLHARRLLMMPDLFNFWLCGSRTTELSIASTTQCYNPRAGRWATELLTTLGIPTAIFGEIVPPGTVLGALRPAVAAASGLRRAVVVAPASHDTQSAVAATPARGEQWAFISSGTWSLMGVERAAPLITPQALAAELTNEVGLGGSINLLTNIVGLWMLQECRRSWQRAGHDHTFAALEQMASGAPPFGALVDPNHPLFINPPDMPAAIRRYCAATAQPPLDSIGATVRCALESLALTYRRVLAGIEAVTGAPVAALHIVGGGSQSALLNQLTADATGRVVYAGPAEASVLGNLLAQMLANGYIGSHAEGRELVRRSFPPRVYEPRQAISPALDQRFADLRHTAPTL